MRVGFDHESDQLCMATKTSGRDSHGRRQAGEIDIFSHQLTELGKGGECRVSIELLAHDELVCYVAIIGVR